jgi:hypothetical protein
MWTFVHASVSVQMVRYLQRFLPLLVQLRNIYSKPHDTHRGEQYTSNTFGYVPHFPPFTCLVSRHVLDREGEK